MNNELVKFPSGQPFDGICGKVGRGRESMVSMTSWAVRQDLLASLFYVENEIITVIDKSNLVIVGNCELTQIVFKLFHRNNNVLAFPMLRSCSLSKAWTVDCSFKSN